LQRNPAGDVADQRSSSKIDESDVRTAKEGMELNRQLELVESLPVQTKAILLSCAYKYNRTRKDLESTDIYSVYTRICDILITEPVKIRRVNDYISELNTLGILSVNKISRGKRKGVYNAIRPLVDTTILEKFILQDSRFEFVKTRSEDAMFQNYWL